MKVEVIARIEKTLNYTNKANFLSTDSIDLDFVTIRNRHRMRGRVSFNKLLEEFKHREKVKLTIESLP